MHNALPWLTNLPSVSPFAVRSMCISEQGPQGPVSPIIQKLSFRLPLTTWIFGFEAGSSKGGCPILVGLLVKRRRITFARGIDRGVKAVRRKLPPFDQKLPGPIDRLFFEVIPKAPVAKHFEERVVIGIETDIIEVIVLAAGSDAFLSIGNTRRRERRFLLAEKIGHELVHARVRKQQIWSAGQQARRWHNRVLFFPEEIQK